MKIQISFSTKCTAECRFCLKKLLVNKFNFVENIDMDLDVAKKILDQKIERIYICSNRGEALLNPKIDEILKYAKEKNQRLDFITNGFYKPAKWWRELGQMFVPGDTVTFALDGSENATHQLHRKTDFNIVLRNIKAFIDAGGDAIWKFIRFEHNQHQVEEARKLSIDIGCQQFNLMNSHTYDSVLKKPTDELVKIWTPDNIKDQNANSLDYLPCRDKTYYINTRGLLFPCCFIANIFSNRPLRITHPNRYFVNLFNEEKELLDLRNNTIEYIVSHSRFFNEIMEKSSICKDPCLKWTRNIIESKER